MRLGNATGVWEIKEEGADINVILIPKDYRFIRELMLKKDISMDEKINKFEDYLYLMIERDDPPITEEERKRLKSYCSRNAFALFEESLVVCKLMTKEDKERKKEILMGDLKKKIEQDSQF